MIQKDTHTSVFISALLTIAKTCKQPKCPLTGEWIKKIWCMYTMEYYSAIKKNEILSFAATQIDLESVILSEVSQTEEKYHMTNIIPYMWNLKRHDTNELTYKTERDSKLENELMVAGRKG